VLFAWCSTIVKEDTIMSPKNKRNKIERRIELDGSLCCWCGKHLERKEVTVEHLIPKSHGGYNAFYNLYLACKPCNQARGNLLLPPKYSLESIGYLKLLEWIKMVKYLFSQRLIE
jgi:5-methylcytosine-specific restriction endonuclease McrA